LVGSFFWWATGFTGAAWASDDGIRMAAAITAAILLRKFFMEG
jgi:hypothetical protein